MNERIRELREKDRIIKKKNTDLRRCSEHLAQIQDLQHKVDEYKRQEEMRKRDDSTEPGPGEQMPKESEKPPATGMDMLNTLKSSIDEFATTYFGSSLRKRPTARLGAGWADKFMQATTPGEDTYMTYLHSRKRCSMIIKAFIWRFLCGTIFNGASWAGSEDMRRHVGELQKILSKCR